MMSAHTARLKTLLAGYGDYSVAEDLKVSGLALDNRKVKAGDLFFACEGSGGHGKDYIGSAIEAGASAVLVENIAELELSQLVNEFPQTSILLVERLSEKLGEIAARFYSTPTASLSLIGITGTNGKTSCAHLIAQCLTDHTQLCGVVGTLGAGLWGELKPIDRTTPNAIELQQLLFEFKQKNTRHVVMEVSSHALDQGRVNACDFDVAVFTNLTRDHLDYHGDLTSYGNAKLKLFKKASLTSVVINLDDPFANTIIKSLEKQIQVVGITLNPKLDVSTARTDIAIVSAANIKMAPQGLSFDLCSPWGACRVNSQLLGDFNISNLLTTFAVAMSLQLDFSQMVSKLALAKAPAGRLEVFSEKAMPLVVVDYAHTPDALEKVMRTLKQYGRGKLHVLFGCGGDRDKGKRAVMGALAENVADVVWLSDDNPRSEKSMDIINDILSGVSNPSKVHIEIDRKTAIQKIISSATAVSDVVLIAGKGHENYQDVGDKRLVFSDREEVAQVLGKAA